VSVWVLSFGATKAIGERSDRGARAAFTAFILTPQVDPAQIEPQHRAIFYFDG
jgi:hypothetical protein